MKVSKTQIKALYLGGVALNAIALAYAIDTGQYLFAATFVLILLFIAYRYRTMPELES